MHIEGNYDILLTVNDGAQDSVPASVTHTAYATMARRMDLLQESLTSYQGNETCFFTEIGWPAGIGFSGELETAGAAFCLPDSPLDPPTTPSSIPPETIYGCTNTIGVDYAVSTDQTNLHITISADSLYLRLDGNYSFPGTTEYFYGYAAVADVVIDADIALTDAGHGVYHFTSITSLAMDYSGLPVVGFDDGLLDPLSNLFLPLFSSSVERMLTGIAGDILEDALLNSMGVIIPAVPIV